eukprot:gene9624-1828_t
MTTREPLLGEVLYGKCYCGKVEYSISGKPLACGHCHCDTCKAFYSTPFNTSAIFKKDGFSFIKGEDLTKTYDTGEVNRYFCSECGTRLANLGKERNIASLPVSILKDKNNKPAKLSALGHVFYDKRIVSVPDMKFKFAGLREKFLLWDTGKDFISPCLSILFFIIILLLVITCIVLAVVLSTK